MIASEPNPLGAQPCAMFQGDTSFQANKVACDRDWVAVFTSSKSLSQQYNRLDLDITQKVICCEKDSFQTRAATCGPRPFHEPFNPVKSESRADLYQVNLPFIPLSPRNFYCAQHSRETSMDPTPMNRQSQCPNYPFFKKMSRRQCNCPHVGSFALPSHARDHKFLAFKIIPLGIELRRGGPR